MRALAQLLALLAALLASASAPAELYKWVDERGVTNYSNAPPADPANVKKLGRVENRISVYTPDEGLLLAAKALRERSIKAWSEPVPEPQGSQFARIPAQPRSGYEQCLASGRLGCDMLYGSYYPVYLPGVVFFPGRPVRPTRFLAPVGMPNAALSGSIPRERAARGMPLR